ncbi:tyrosine-type recombinase/integrase [Streptomyces sp. NBC_00728]|uniref:tyrosine-type recombinase/integrase n=1 Tax=Streptomyces sp. NBC_00728 TaxID=2903676 RepID=UPI0038648828
MPRATGCSFSWAAFTGLRFGEPASLRRRAVDTTNATLMVQRSQAEMQTGALFDKAPKSDAGARPVAFPTELLPDVKNHLDSFAGAGRDGHVFLGHRGGRLRRSNFRDDWIKARAKARITADVHFHDLRHTGNTLAASGASLRELMTRMGHSTPRAALIYRHVVSGRDREIADRLGSMIRKTRGRQTTSGPCGTAAFIRKGQFERIKPLNWPLAVCPRQDSNLRHPL